MWFGVNETMVGTHSGWKVPASIDLSLASAVTFNWSEPRYAALFRKDLPPRNNTINGRYAFHPLWVPTVRRTFSASCIRHGTNGAERNSAKVSLLLSPYFYFYELPLSRNRDGLSRGLCWWPIRCSDHNLRIVLLMLCSRVPTYFYFDRRTFRIWCRRSLLVSQSITISSKRCFVPGVRCTSSCQRMR